MVAPVNPRADWLALRLDPKHVEILSARAIAPSVAKERGVFSVHTKQRLAELGFGRNQQVTPSLVIPSFNALGEIGVYVNRPDQPRYKDGRLLKYEFPASSQAPLDIPVRVRPQLRDPKQRLVITEGALKADAAVSHGLTCIATWGVWPFARHAAPLIDWDNIELRHRDVFLAFDSDVLVKRAVRRALERFRGFLEQRHAEVWIVHLLPGPGGGKVGLDDYLAEGHAGDDVFGLADRELPPLPTLSRDEDGRPVLNVGERDLAIVTPAAWDVLLESNEPERLFQRGREPVRLDGGGKGEPRVTPLRTPELRYELTRAARCVKYHQREGGFVEVAERPDDKLLENMAATPELPLPELVRVVTVPVFGPDGSLVTEPGYHPGTGLYYAPPPGLSVPDVSSNPTGGEIRRALHWIADLLYDFPFLARGDRAHALALMLVAFVRELIKGPTPNHLIDAPQAGTGKGLLAQACLYPAVGLQGGHTMAPARGEEEWQKRITSGLRAGRDVIVLDNVTGTLNSPSLAAVLTSRVWENRLLGQNLLLALPVRCVWVTTANNAQLSTELARRSIRIRIDAKQENPWERTREQFRHGNLLEWAGEHRAALIWSLLTLVQNWIARGRQAGSGVSLGSYEEWARVMDGVLSAAGVAGFLTNLDDFYERAVDEGSAWREFVARWWHTQGSRDVTTADLLPVAQRVEGIEIRGDGDKAQVTSLGKQLGAHVDRIISDKQICMKKGAANQRLWFLSPIDPSERNERSPGQCSNQNATEGHCALDSGSGGADVHDVHDVHLSARAERCPACGSRFVQRPSGPYCLTCDGEVF